MKSSIIYLFLIVFTGASVQAGIMIEPYLGYSSNTFEYQIINAEVEKDQASGLGYGLRLGYKFAIPWIAMDYKTTNEKIKDWTIDGRDADLVQTQIGLVFGADLPMGFRIFGGYGFDNKFSAKVDSFEDTFKGTYTKVGLGMRPIPLMSINLEYIMNKYTKMSLAQAGNVEVDTSSLFSKTDMNTVFISVSLPLNL